MASKTCWKRFMEAAQKNIDWLEELHFDTKQADLLDYMGQFGDDCVANALRKQIIPTITGEQTKALLDFIDDGVIPNYKTKEESTNRILSSTKAFANEICDKLNNKYKRLIDRRACLKYNCAALIGYDLTIIRLFESDNTERYYAKNIHQLPPQFENCEQKFDEYFEKDTYFAPVTSRVYVLKDDYIAQFYD